MCGRFALDQTTDALIAEFVASTNRFPLWAPRWNIAPTSTIPIVVTNDDGERIVGPARWSLVPPWSTELTLKYPTFNARSETAAEKPTFRGSVNKSRCIVPISGYYEWTSMGGTKQPHFVYRPGQAVVGLAGLYSWWTNPASGEIIATATILTREGAGVLAEVHDRMPIALEPDDRDRWLSRDHSDGALIISDVSETAARNANSWDHYEVAPLRGDGPELRERKDEQ